MTKSLQHLQSTGNWSDVAADRRDEYLTRAAEYNNVSADKIAADLETGRKIETGSDWYDTIRLFDSAALRAEMAAERANRKPSISCDECGQTGHAGQYPFSTLGTNVCDDCC